MKKVKHLDRVQAVIPPTIIIILATIQEHALKSELAINNYSLISLQFDIYVFEKLDSQTSFMWNLRPFMSFCSMFRTVRIRL